MAAVISRVPFLRRLKDNRRQPGHGHLVRIGRPGHEVLEAIEREGPQDALAQHVRCPAQVVIGKHVPQRRHRELVAAARIPEQMPPAACLVDPPPASPRDRRARPGDHRDAIAFPKCRREARLAVAAHCHDRGGPDPLDQRLEPLAVRGVGATGQEDAHVRGLRRQHAQEIEQILIPDEAQIRGRERAHAQLAPVLRPAAPIPVLVPPPSTPRMSLGDWGGDSTILFDGTIMNSEGS